MATSGIIKTSPSGTEIVGNSDGDTLIWDEALGIWRAEPGGGRGAVDSVFGRTGEVNAEAGDYSATLVSNTSDVVGANVAEALDTLRGQFINLSSDNITNNSAVPGANITEAIDNLDGEIAALTSSDIANSSAVSGVTVTNALDTLNTNIVAALAGRLLGAAERRVAGAQVIACPSGTRRVLVRMVGAGGGGGGAAQTATPSQTNSGGGGGGTGAEQWFLYISATDIASVSVSCGTAGTGQATTGGNGTATTVTINGETFTSNPGEGGSQGIVTSAPLGTGGRGGLPGQFNFQTGSNFVLLASSGGQPGENGTGPNASTVFWYGGMGGSGTFGGGGRGGVTSNGEAGTGNGSGGGGGSSSAGNARSGGNGTPGAVALLFFA